MHLTPTKIPIQDQEEYELSEDWNSEEDKNSSTVKIGPLNKDEEIEVKRGNLDPNHKFYNEDLLTKTDKIQEEFQRLMGELQNKRDNTDRQHFYDLMDEFYGRGEKDKKHSSPTRRYIKQKDNAVEHKKLIKDNMD